jgi:prepilin-type processing-associated H-X9-DG protein
VAANPQSVQFQKGGTISIDTPSIPSSATVLIRDGNGTAKTTHVAAMVTTINTTITGALSAHATALNVASNTGLQVGSVAWLRDDPEEVVVARVATLAIALRRPVLYSHISGAQLQGSRVTFSVNAQVANALWWDGHAEWNLGGTLDYTAVNCTRYPMTRRASSQDLFDLEPKLSDVLDGEQDVERLLDLAHDHVMGEIGKVSPLGWQRFTSTTGAAQARSRETWQTGTAATSAPRWPASAP